MDINKSIIKNIKRNDGKYKAEKYSYIHEEDEKKIRSR